MKKDKKKGIKEGRLSGQYKKALTKGLVEWLKWQGLTIVQSRRVLSYAYQSLREVECNEADVPGVYPKARKGKR